MKNPILIPELRELLKKRKLSFLKTFLEEQHEKEIAEYISLLAPEEIWRIMILASVSRRAEIFSYLDMDVQVALASGPHRKMVAQLLMEMPPDDRADLFQHLEKDVADRLLLLLPLKERMDIISLTTYREETAGAIMTTDYATLVEHDYVDAAIKKIRREAPSKETIYYIYVTDHEGRLIGFVSLRKLILSKPRRKINEIMKRDVVYAYVDDDQEIAARLIEEYDLIALPVVDRTGRLQGIITHDDAMDIIREEQTEDLEKIMAISGGVEDKPYLDVPVHVHFRKRVSWIIVLAFVELLSGLIIQGYRETLQNLIILAYYMPLLNSTGGNTGSQSATVVLRSIALGELSPGDIFKVLRKEFYVSLLISACVGVLVSFRVILLSHGSSDIPPDLTLSRIAFMISLALSIQVIWSTVLGAVIPMIASKTRIDPAVVSSPAIATLVDLGGVTIYFTSAKLLLGV